MTELINRLDCTGSIFKQTEEAEAFLSVANALLRQLFYRLDIVEAIGAGLKRIYELYEEEELTPTVKSTGNWFCLSLPNINTTRNPHLSLRHNDGPNLRGEYQDYEKLDDGGMLPPEVARAFASIRLEHEKAEEALGVGRDVTLKVINGMIEDGEVIKEGKARATRYRVARA